MNNVTVTTKVTGQITNVKPPVLQWDSEEEIKTYAKVYLAGAGGGGKTRMAIELAKEFVPDESKIGVINTEGSSGAKVYRKLYPNLKIMTLKSPYNPQTFVEGINRAITDGMEAIIIDSATDEWHGVLTLVNNSTISNDFAKWKIPTKLHDEYLALIKNSPVHIFATVRTKVKHAQVKNPNGGTGVRKLPGSMIQREEFDKEFDLGLVMTEGGTATVDKTHYDTIKMGMQFDKNANEIAKLIKDFLYPEVK